MSGDGPAAGPADPTAAVEVVVSEAVQESTVVVVDDNPANVALLERVLAGVGVGRVHGFVDPRRALEHCAASLPDLVLLDLHMPHLDGFAVMEALDDVVPDGRFLPILVLTADATPKVKEQVLAAGAKDFLTKPFDRTEVELRVGNLLETRALYGRLERHVASLQATVDEHAARLREAELVQERCRRRVEQAMAPGTMEMVFQPVVDLTDGGVVGVEALARFACEPRRPPNEWFAEADQVGLGVTLELRAVEAALRCFGELPPDAFLAVNVSPATAASPAFEPLVARHPGDRVVVELTEHTRVDDYDTLLAAVDSLRRHGVRIAADDTGAGYAGLQHLLRLRPDIIKLDLDLTRGIDVDPARLSLAAGLVNFAGEIGATIVAEGVEVPSELTTLQSLDVPWGQGYHLGRPGPIAGAADRRR